MHDESTGDSVEADARLLEGDAYDRLADIADTSIQLVVTSPPYNLRKEYERDTSLSLQEYLAWLKPIIVRLCEKISSTGSVCWQVGNYVRNGEVFPLDYFFYQIFTEAGFKLRNRIVWHFNFGLHATKRFSGRYETLLWFSRSDNYTFQLNPVRVPQLYPGKRHSKSKAHRAGKLSSNPLGKNPSDLWTFSASDSFFDNPIWDIPNIKSNHSEYTAHPCQFPHELAERCILALSAVGDSVLDPFVGAGTTVVAALKAGRHGIGIDRSPEYLAIAARRVQDLREGVLRLRPSGLATQSPNLRDKVARYPTEWISEAAE